MSENEKAEGKEIDVASQRYIGTIKLDGGRSLVLYLEGKNLKIFDSSSATNSLPEEIKEREEAYLSKTATVHLPLSEIKVLQAYQGGLELAGSHINIQVPGEVPLHISIQDFLRSFLLDHGIVRFSHPEEQNQYGLLINASDKDYLVLFGLEQSKQQFEAPVSGALGRVVADIERLNPVYKQLGEALSASLVPPRPTSERLIDKLGDSDLKTNLSRWLQIKSAVRKNYEPRKLTALNVRDPLVLVLKKLVVFAEYNRLLEEKVGHAVAFKRALGAVANKSLEKLIITSKSDGVRDETGGGAKRTPGRQIAPDKRSAGSKDQVITPPALDEKRSSEKASTAETQRAFNEGLATRLKDIFISQGYDKLLEILKDVHKLEDPLKLEAARRTAMEISQSILHVAQKKFDEEMKGLQIWQEYEALSKSHIAPVLVLSIGLGFFSWLLFPESNFDVTFMLYGLFLAGILTVGHLLVEANLGPVYGKLKKAEDQAKLLEKLVKDFERALIISGEVEPAGPGIGPVASLANKIPDSLPDVSLDEPAKKRLKHQEDEVRDEEAEALQDEDSVGSTKATST